MTRSAAFVVGLVLLWAAGAGTLGARADVAGAWNMTYTTREGVKMASTLTLKMDGEKLTGTISSPRGTVALDEVSVTGDAIAFAIIRVGFGDKIRIDYTALSFKFPRGVLFRYKLEGQDPDWHDAGVRRQALYNDLRPGHYRFRVMASNDAGVWNEAGATLDFMLSATRNADAAERFFRKVLDAGHTMRPRVITVDQNAAYPLAFEALQRDVQQYHDHCAAGRFEDAQRIGDRYWGPVRDAVLGRGMRAPEVGAEEDTSNAQDAPRSEDPLALTREEALAWIDEELVRVDRARADRPFHSGPESSMLLAAEFDGARDVYEGALREQKRSIEAELAGLERTRIEAQELERAGLAERAAAVRHQLAELEPRRIALGPRLQDVLFLHVGLDRNHVPPPSLYLLDLEGNAERRAALHRALDRALRELSEQIAQDGVTARTNPSPRGVAYAEDSRRRGEWTRTTVSSRRVTRTQSLSWSWRLALARRSSNAIAHFSLTARATSGSGCRAATRSS